MREELVAWGFGILIILLVFGLVYNILKPSKDVPLRSYVLGLASFPNKELCDYQFIEYEDRVEVKKLHCIKLDRELAEELIERFLNETNP